MTKFESQALHIIRIKYQKAGWSGTPPFLIPALWNILLPKQATRAKHFEPECIYNSTVYTNSLVNTTFGSGKIIVLTKFCFKLRTNLT